jgi:hypothetical protein
MLVHDRPLVHRDDGADQRAIGLALIGGPNQLGAIATLVEGHRVLKPKVVMNPGSLF